MRPWLWSVAFAAAFAGPAFPEGDLAERAHRLVASRCIRCHGGVHERAGLNLAWRDRASAPREGSPAAIAVGDPSGSGMMARVADPDPDRRMPPEGPALSAEDVGLLREWIAAGAAYPEPWSQRPLGGVAPQACGVPGWDASGIDRITACGLRDAGIPVPAAAEPRALVRRAALDLTGLPPDPALVERHAADPSEESWARTVDALLADPAFGERWARPWLDLARYADTKGYEKDARREVWRFRDWLVDALNADMPYGAFVERVLAGDLLPGATDQDRVATAFHRLTLVNDEGGTDDEEFRTAAVMDRNATTWLAFMGTSMQCVQCHAHPYDPIDHREYYAALAFLNQTADADREDDAPVLDVPWARGATRVPVMRELAPESRRLTRVFRRGNWRDPGDEVRAAVPRSFPPLAAVQGEPSRLDLARWIADPGNARAMRVEANRIWETLLGRGPVETSEEFGMAGSGPVRPELLDWLAARLVASGGSRKALIREIALSRTYRMDARPSPEALRLDPGNLIPSRAPRFRLEAEAVRDQALAVSGLLDRTMHGPPVFPHQPEGTWMVVYSGDAWTTSEGGDRWRRALYTFWRRTSPHPSLAAFDAVSRETCTVRRVRTNSPLAALAALNDPTYAEAARALAKRAIVAVPAGDDLARARWMLQAALVRVPGATEVDRLARLVRDERAASAAAPPGAGSADAGATELEAWSAAAAVVLNLDEFLSRT